MKSSPDVHAQDPQGVITPMCPTCISGVDPSVVQDDFRDALLDAL